MLKDNTQILSWGKFLIGWPISLISLFFIVKLILDKSSDLDIRLIDINFLYLLFSIFIFFIYFLMRSFLWQQQLRGKGYRIPFRKNTYAFAFSELKRYVPGNIWSFLSRGVQFAELGVDKKTIGISILADIQLVIIGCGIVSLLSIEWILRSQSKLLSFASLPVSAIVIAVFFSTTAILYTKKFEEKRTKSTILPSIRLFSNLLLPGFQQSSKIKLSILSIITYFIFGVGNYFAFLSIFNGGFQNFLELSSFFVFSLLIGYLSFITPMGLGVREVVVTLGLSKITTLSFAGAISIYTRIVFIASEVLFLIIIFIWEKSYRKK